MPTCDCDKTIRGADSPLSVVPRVALKCRGFTKNGQKCKHTFGVGTGDLETVCPKCNTWNYFRYTLKPT